MINGLLRDVSDAEIEQYRVQGVVCLRGILGPEWVGPLAAHIDELFDGQREAAPVYYDSTETADALGATGAALLRDEQAAGGGVPGHFHTIIGGWTISGGIRRLALESPLGYIAARLFGARKVNFYDDQVLNKEAHTREYTAFHTDEPYYHLAGDQVCGMWISPDVVPENGGAMEYVRGSHRWPGFFKPNAFISQQSLTSLGLAEDDDQQLPLPDIEGHRDEYDIVRYPSKPGDVIVHHSRLIHGAGPNYTDHHRRAVSLRYAGDDVRYRFHRSAPPQPHHRHSLVDGDAIDCDQFPVVWRQES